MLKFHEAILLVNCCYLFFSSGLGYIVGTGVAKLLGGWQWGLRVSVSMLLSKD